MSLPRKVTRVFHLSKLSTLVLFIILLFLGFYLGINYQKNKQEIELKNYDPYQGSSQMVISIKPREKVIEYKAINGDSLKNLAEKFSISENTIKWANNLTSDYLLVGSILKIPPVTGVVHTVVKGETIYSIAAKYNTTSAKIVNFPFNDFKDLNTFGLTQGQILYVPDGTKN